MKHSRLAAYILAVAALFSALFVAGCGGGGGGTGPGDPAVLVPGVAGTVYSLANGVLDYPYDAEVVLYRELSAGGEQEVARSRSHVRGGYQFANVEPGTYTIRATTQTMATATQPSMALTGEVHGVVVSATQASLMQNIVVGDPSKQTTFSGVVTQDRQQAEGAVAPAPVPGASVSLEIVAYDLGYLNSGRQDEASVMVTTMTDGQGHYQITIPASGHRFMLSAHSDSSNVMDADPIAVPSGSEPQANYTQDFHLGPATAPVFPNLRVLFALSTTLSAPTAQASQEAAIMQLAAARAGRSSIPKWRRDMLEKRLQALPTSRSGASMVENDVYFFDSAWYDPGTQSYNVSLDPSVRGYYVDRAEAPRGQAARIGSVPYAWQTFFFDNDPSLEIGKSYRYTVYSFAANGAVSSPSLSVSATALPQLVQGLPDGATLSLRAGDRLIWQPVTGAQSYEVFVYEAEPTANPTDPIQYDEALKGDVTSVPLRVPAGTYWWGVAAYNAAFPGEATAASFSEFRKVTVTQ